MFVSLSLREEMQVRLLTAAGRPCGCDDFGKGTVSVKMVGVTDVGEQLELC